MKNDLHIRVIEDTSTFNPSLSIVLLSSDELGYNADDDMEYAEELFTNDCPEEDAEIEAENPYNTYLVSAIVAVTLLDNITNANQNTIYGGTIREVITEMAKGD